MGKPTICKGENKGADQLRSNCEAEQLPCFRYTDSTIPLLSKSKISSLYPSSVTVQPGLCRTWSELKLLVFSFTDSYDTVDSSSCQRPMKVKRISMKRPRFQNHVKIFQKHNKNMRSLILRIECEHVSRNNRLFSSF